MGNAVSGRKLNSDMMLELESFLEANALCNSSVLGPSGLEKMIKEARLMDFDINEQLFKKGDSIQAIFFVRAGFVHVTDREDGSGGVLLTTGALIDAGGMMGSGVMTEKRTKYITRAKVSTECNSAEVYVIPMIHYHGALNKLKSVIKSKEFRVMAQTAIFHDLHQSDIMRLYNKCDMREYSPGSHILRHGAKQSFYMYILVSGECVATSYTKNKMNHQKDPEQAHPEHHHQDNPVHLRAPTYFNEECLVRLGREESAQNETQLCSSKFRKKVCKKYKDRKCNMSIKVGKTGCIVLSLSYRAFHEHCVAMSGHYYAHFMRRMEDMEIAAEAALLLEQALQDGNVATMGSPKKYAVFSGQMANETSTCVEEELLHMKGLHFRNPEPRDVTVFNTAPIIKVRVMKKAIQKSLMDCTEEDLDAHFNVMAHMNDKRVEIQKTGQEELAVASREGHEHDHMHLADHIGHYDLNGDGSIPASSANGLSEGGLDKKTKKSKKDRDTSKKSKKDKKKGSKEKADGSGSDVGGVPSSSSSAQAPVSSLMSSLFGSLSNESTLHQEIQQAKANKHDTSDEDEYASGNAPSGKNKPVEKTTSDAESSDHPRGEGGLADLITSPLDSIFSLVGVIPVIAGPEEAEETMDVAGAAVLPGREGTSENQELSEIDSAAMGGRKRRFSSHTPQNASHYAQSSSDRGRNKSYAKIHLHDSENHQAGVTFAEGPNSSSPAKVGNNLLFGLFDTVLCGAPDIVCGDGKSQSLGSGQTPVA